MAGPEDVCRCGGDLRGARGDVGVESAADVARLVSNAVAELVYNVASVRSMPSDFTSPYGDAAAVLRMSVNRFIEVIGFVENLHEPDCASRAFHRRLQDAATTLVGGSPDCIDTFLSVVEFPRAHFDALVEGCSPPSPA
jgi:hypothetical protein